MDTRFQPIYKQAAAMQHTFHDYTHKTAYDPSAAVIRNEMHALTNDIAAGKSAQTIDNRLKNIDKYVKQTQLVNPAITPGQNPVLNYNQRNYLSRNLQTMRQSIRPHF